MAKGKEEHEARLAALQRFGKDLARRAKSKCELCETAGERLTLYELPPVTREPDFDRCVLLCASCHEQASDPRRFRPGAHWRFLESQAWSLEPVVQVLAIRLLRRLASREDWARVALESLDLDEATEALVTEAE